MKKLFATDDSVTAFILRLMLGIVIFPHGAQKLFGWFGGFGFSGTMGAFTESMGIPSVVAFLVIIGESFGAIGLIAGFLTRFTAASLAVIMLGAIRLAHWQHGFFMNWFGQQKGEGFEFHLLFLAICAALMIMGGGKWSVDREISKRLAA
ncbi:MAG: DoxX family protein [Nitrospiria bacterium]